MDFSCEAFKAARLKSSLSQNKVNELCGFAPARYAVIERGKKDPTPEEVKTIASVLGIIKPNKEKKHVTRSARNSTIRNKAAVTTVEDIGDDRPVGHGAGEGSGYDETPSPDEDGKGADEEWG